MIKNNKEIVGIILVVLISVAIVILGIWAWWFADCSTIKSLNFNAPGRCIQ